MWGFIVKNWKFVLIALLGVGLFVAIGQIKSLAAKYHREANNTEALIDQIDQLKGDIKHQKTKLDEDVVTIKELQYTVQEFKQREKEDAALIKSLKIKLKEAKEVVKTVVETEIKYRDSLIYISPGKFVWAKDTTWWSVREEIDLESKPAQIDMELQVRDSLTHILYKVPKFKIFGIHFGTKGYEIKVINHNPDSEVKYSSWITLSKKQRKNR